MQRKIYLVLILLSILFSGFLYQKLVFDFKDELFYEERMVGAYKKNIFLIYNILNKESLFLKIKTPQQFPIEKVFFNKNYTFPQNVNLRGTTYTYYFFIPRQYVYRGKNILEIKLSSIPNLNIDVRIYNYRKKFLKNLIVFLKDNHIFKKSKNIFDIFFVIFLLLFICFVILKLLNKIIISLEKIYFYLLFFLLSPNIFLTLAYFIPFKIGFRIAMNVGFFFSSYIISMIITLSLLLLKRVLKINKSEEVDSSFLPLWKARVEKIYLWVRKKEFSHKCIILFMVLLLFCALFLSIGLESIAEQFANIAYFLLVIGVLGKFIKFLGEKENEF